MQTSIVFTSDSGLVKESQRESYTLPDSFWEHISFTALIDALEVFCPIIFTTF